MPKKHSSGFTLIELLVVIAIIGILAALVLVALGNARDKANDARIKSNIGQLRTLAEVHYDSNSASYASYGGATGCIGAPSATTCEGGIEDSVTSLTADTTTAGGTITSSSDADDFCVSSPLNSDASTIVCVDASGAFTEGTQACNTTSHTCS